MNAPADTAPVIFDVPRFSIRIFQRRRSGAEPGEVDRGMVLALFDRLPTSVVSEEET